MKNVTLVCDLQFGSTGKGLISGMLAERDKPDVVVTAWSANAGHTYIDTNNRKYVHCMLANGVVSPNLKYILLGPGSNLDINRLELEIQQCNDLLSNVKILVHPHATIIQDKHVAHEKATMNAIGSTAKGCGAALINKIQRQPHDPVIAQLVCPNGGTGWQVADYDEYNEIIDAAERILVEGHQGFSLGLNTGFYPYVTSRECTPAQILVDCHIPINKLNKVIGCMRTYPIRTADRFDEQGNKIGWCGPVYPDQHQIEWSQLSLEPELTTVTQKPRKIFTFSIKQAAEAIRTCAPDEIFLNFCNYMKPRQVELLVNDITKVGGNVRYLGYGPTVNGITENTSWNLTTKNLQLSDM